MSMNKTCPMSNLSSEGDSRDIISSDKVSRSADPRAMNRNRDLTAAELVSSAGRRLDRKAPPSTFRGWQSPLVCRRDERVTGRETRFLSQRYAHRWRRRYRILAGVSESPRVLQGRPNRKQAAR